MCGRYAFFANQQELANEFGIEIDPDLQLKPRYNIAPSQQIPVIITENGKRKVILMRWGLVPFWAKDTSIGNKMINARAETIAEKPAFRQAVKKRRCLIPTNGFYEWKKEGATKTPMWIYPRGQAPFAFAGIWESWHPEGKEEETLLSASILTTEPNDFMKSIHNRMPVIPTDQAIDLWMDPEVTEVAKLQPCFKTLPGSELTAHAVLPLVNSPWNDRPDLIDPAIS